MKNVIVNADDFGASPGINSAIIDCHVGGIVTSASLMVTGAAADEAGRLARAHPSLAVGLHFDVFGEGPEDFDTSDLRAVRLAFTRQLDDFERVVGAPPSHVDSHKHVHLYEHLVPLFTELVDPLDVPLRGDGRVRYVGGFYAQWEPGVTDPAHVSVDALASILRDEVGDGWTEIGCHPGYYSAAFHSSYGHDAREAEARTLRDPRARAAIESLEIRLASFKDYGAEPSVSAS